MPAKSLADAPEATLPRSLVRRPRITTMTRRQIDFVLTRNHVARVAFMDQGRIELRPVHYVYSDGVLFGRTSFGPQARAWHAKPEVVVEVDEVRALYLWRSIIIRGTISLLKPRGSPEDRAEYWRAVHAIRALVSTALTERDPTPHRTFVFRVDPTEITGREATP
jgi:nitroimidazol reductase NimA-like FMN-containing flavoprotein (pyridoxamine 5'-phosphate oxidase superfamily)